MIERYLEGRWRLLPGNGRSIGNYVFVEDVVDGHILAMKNGRHGERYILGGDNLSYRDLFQLVRDISGLTHRLYEIPVQVMLGAAWLMELRTRLTGKAPMITRGLVRKFSHHWIVSSGKAQRELGYEPRSGRAGIRETIAWLHSPARASGTH
jgi:nucleoside-diphosphate-sugar epimerase